MRHILALCALLAVAACQTPVTTALTLTPTPMQSYGDKIAGNYGIVLHTGAWTKKVIMGPGICSAWTFPMNIDSAYQDMARKAFTSSFEKVEFLNTGLKPNEITARGIDAEIIIFQRYLHPIAFVRQNMFSGHLDASVAMGGLVIVIDPAGRGGQGFLKSDGHVEKDITHCSEIGAPMTQAGQAALSDFVEASVKTARNLVEAWRSRNAEGK
jgi:hypothetical protein